MWAQYIFFSPDYLPRWPPIFMLHKLFLLYSSISGHTDGGTLITEKMHPVLKLLPKMSKSDCRKKFMGPEK